MYCFLFCKAGLAWPLKLHILILETLPKSFPAGDLKLTTADVFIQGYMKAVNEVGAVPLDEPRYILAEMLAGFGDEIAEFFQHFVADTVFVRNVLILDYLPKQRVEVCTVAFEVQVKGHVIDARAYIVDIFNRYADVICQLVGSPLDTMAQANSFDTGAAVDGPAVHGHRIHILKQRCMRAEFLHVSAHIEQDRNCTQGPHNPADTEGIGNCLPQPVFLRNFKIYNRAGSVPSHLNHGDHIISSG